MVRSIHQQASEMLFLTPSDKRERIISDAVTAFLKDDLMWFDQVKARIENGMHANPGKREQVVIKWIKSAENISATVVKDEIMKQYVAH